MSLDLAGLRVLRYLQRFTPREALRKATKRDLEANLDKHALAPTRAPAVLERMTASGQFVAAVQTLLACAREIDEIA